MPRMARAVLPFGDSTQPCVTLSGSGTEGDFLGPLSSTIPLPCAGVPGAAGAVGHRLPPHQQCSAF